MHIRTEWLGKTAYADSLALQNRAGERARQYSTGVILGTEHPLVITLGVRGNVEKDVTPEAVQFVVQTRRGGQATLHNEGQLVIYPVLNLKDLKLRPKCYVQMLMDTTATCLREYGVEAREGLTPGLFVDNTKIASFGVQIERGVTKHGLAINVSNDLTAFSKIRVCGVTGQKLTSIQNLGISILLEDVFQNWVTGFLGRLQVLTPHLNPTTLNSSLELRV